MQATENFSDSLNIFPLLKIIIFFNESNYEIPFLYSMKASKNQMFCDVFWRFKKEHRHNNGY